MNVRAHVLLKARVNEINATSGPKEGKQRHDIHKCVTLVVSLSEWNWRFQAAHEILCGGSTDYTSYGDAIGSGWI